MKWKTFFPRVLWLNIDAFNIKTYFGHNLAKIGEYWSLHAFSPFVSELFSMFLMGYTCKQETLSDQAVIEFLLTELFLKKEKKWCLKEPQDGALYDPKIPFSEFSFLGGTPTSICHFFRPFVRLSVCRAPYLRNRTSSDDNFWYTYVK